MLDADKESMEIIIKDYPTGKDMESLIKKIIEQVRRLEKNYSFYGKYTDTQIENSINKAFSENKEKFSVLFFTAFGIAGELR